MNKPNYTELEHTYKTVHQFLSGYFHQDVESLEQGMREFFDNSTEAITKGLVDLKRFVKTEDLTDLQKNEFIRDHVSYQFEDNNIEPLTWFKGAIDQIEEHLRNI